MKIEFARSEVLLTTSLMALALAFVSSWLVGVGTIGEEWRTVSILGANPNSYVQWTWGVLELGILPVGTGIVLCVTGFVLQRKAPRTSRSLPLLVVGGFFGGWGVFYFLLTLFSYNAAISVANQLHVSGIQTSLEIIYAEYGLVAVLWFVSGVLFAASGYVRRSTPTERLD